MSVQIENAPGQAGYVLLVFDRDIDANPLRLAICNRISRRFLGHSVGKANWSPARSHFFDAELVSRANGKTVFKLGPEVATFIPDETTIELTSEDSAICEVAVWSNILLDFHWRARDFDEKALAVQRQEEDKRQYERDETERRRRALEDERQRQEVEEQKRQQVKAADEERKRRQLEADSRREEARDAARVSEQVTRVEHKAGAPIATAEQLINRDSVRANANSPTPNKLLSVAAASSVAASIVSIGAILGSCWHELHWFYAHLFQKVP